MLDLVSPLRYKRTVMQGDTMVMKGVVSRRLYEHLAGSVVMDSDKVMRIISEGGGTPVMRPHLRFVNIGW